LYEDDFSFQSCCKLLVGVSKATATLPPASRSAIMPEPTTIASNIAVPKPSATVRRARFVLIYTGLSAQHAVLPINFPVASSLLITNTSHSLSNRSLLYSTFFPALPELIVRQPALKLSIFFLSHPFFILLLTYFIVPSPLVVITLLDRKHTHTRRVVVDIITT